LEASARAAFWEQSQKAPSSLWAASSQLLDVTVFPALVKGRPKKPEKPDQEKKWEEESGAKPREGLRRRCRQMARLLSNTDSGNTRAWFIYGEKPSVAPKGMSR